MTPATKRKKKAAGTFEQRYHAGLLSHVRNPGEETLGEAYELGRSAIAEGKSLLDLASIHHQAIQGMVHEAAAAEVRKQILSCGASFLMESLSPFEMTHRGFQDAVKSLRHLNDTLEAEIKRIAYAVHDDAGQLLVAVHLALAEFAGGLPEQKKQQLMHVEGLLGQVEKQLRRFSHELRPTILDDLGWISAIRFLADGVTERTGLQVKFESKVKGRLPEAQETVLYRVVQEALTNATKHSKARSVRIQVQQRGLQLCCRVRDDGAGFNPQVLQSNNARKGLGLVAMRERLNAIGGTLSVDSAEGQGTTLLIQIPREALDERSHRPRR
ncbi:MAG: ATP-binding protein [Candidatus Acidiferrum sp.]